MVAYIQYLEDQQLLAKAEAARNEGYARNHRASAFLSDFIQGNTNNDEPENDKSGDQIPGKP
jgi:hypothetical protein